MHPQTVAFLMYANVLQGSMAYYYIVIHSGHISYNKTATHEVVCSLI
jgi:hypothetical protein